MNRLSPVPILNPMNGVEVPAEQCLLLLCIKDGKRPTLKGIESFISSLGQAFPEVDSDSLALPPCAEVLSCYHEALDTWRRLAGEIGAGARFSMDLLHNPPAWLWQEGYIPAEANRDEIARLMVRLQFSDAIKLLTACRSSKTPAEAARKFGELLRLGLARLLYIQHQWDPAAMEPTRSDLGKMAHLLRRVEDVEQRHPGLLPRDVLADAALYADCAIPRGGRRFGRRMALALCKDISPLSELLRLKRFRADPISAPEKLLGQGGRLVKTIQMNIERDRVTRAKEEKTKANAVASLERINQEAEGAQEPWEHNTPDADSLSPEQLVLEDEAAEAGCEMLRKKLSESSLSEREKVAVVLALDKKLKPKEIAHAMGCTPGQVYGYLKNAKKKYPALREGLPHHRS